MYKNIIALAVLLMIAGWVMGDSPAVNDSRELIWKDGKWVRIAKPAEGTAEGELSLIRLQYDSKQYSQALNQAEKFLAARPTDPNCEEAMCIAGQCMMQNDDYYAAFEMFEKQIRTYPNGPLLERALSREFEIADAFCNGKKKKTLKVLKLSAVEEGLMIMDGIANKVPGSVLAEKVSLYIADHHYNAKDYDQAMSRYDEFLKNYPNSEKAGYASLQAARSAYNQYKGDKFDDTPLADAYQRYGDYLKKYPAQAKNNGVEGILRDITDKINERAWETAAFYKRVGKKKPAAFYFRRIIKQAPGTVWEQNAQNELAEMGFSVE